VATITDTIWDVVRAKNAMTKRGTDNDKEAMGRHDEEEQDCCFYNVLALTREPRNRESVNEDVDNEHRTGAGTVGSAG
jgi:hypothetical protein